MVFLFFCYVFVRFDCGCLCDGIWLVLCVFVLVWWLDAFVCVGCHVVCGVVWFALCVCFCVCVCFMFRDCVLFLIYCVILFGVFL